MRRNSALLLFMSNPPPRIENANAITTAFFIAYFLSYSPAITRIPTRRLALPDNLDHLSPPQAQILSDGIPGLDARQLALLEAIALEQFPLLLRAQEHVLGHEFMVGDVDQQILFLERFDDGRQHYGHDLQRGRRNGCLRHQDARVEVVLADVLGEGAHLLNADR